jgi:glucose/arabinose dehydrogenase
MRRLIATTSIASVLVLLAGAAGNAGGVPTQPTAVGAVAVVTGLDFPAGFAIAPDGRFFYGERFTGEVRIYDPSNSSNTLFATIPNISIIGEQGLLGVALHPNYPTTPYVYVYATRNLSGVLRNQIIVLRDTGGVGRHAKVIWSSNTVAGDYHDGGHIDFGPDGMLYAVVGEGHDPSNAQNLNNDAGKVLRMTDRGTVPPDNPFAGKLIWTYGLRNSYGFAVDPQNGNLWEDENGPECNDELNRIVKGSNYGWGTHETCSTPPPPPMNTNQDGPNPVLPQWYFASTIAPVGMAFCQGCGVTDVEGKFLFGAFNDSRIRAVTLSADRSTIVSVTVVYTHSSFPLSMQTGPDGTLYFSDSGGIWKIVQA